MKPALAIALILVLLAAAVLIAGYLLPATREGTATRILNAPRDAVRLTILDISAQPEWRTGVSAVERTGPNMWTEIKSGGERITFRLAEDTGARIALTFQSTRGYTGRWEGQLEDLSDGTTRLTVREEATIGSPVGRILARLLFDPEDFASQYLAELDTEVARRRTEGRKE